MARPVSALELTPEEAVELGRRVRAPTTTQRDALRARLILARAERRKEKQVADQLGVSLACVSKCPGALRSTAWKA